MALKSITPKSYSDIERGANLRIPVSILDSDQDPIDLTDYKAHFTLKAAKTDYDWYDARAFISKTIEVNDYDPENGYFYFSLSSKDTYIPPGPYFFDIELESPGNGIVRLVTFETNLIGGPTNRTVNDSIDDIISGDTIKGIIYEDKKIVIIAPILLDQPHNVIEDIRSNVEGMISWPNKRNAEFRFHGPIFEFFDTGWGTKGGEVDHVLPAYQFLPFYRMVISDKGVFSMSPGGKFLTLDTHFHDSLMDDGRHLISSSDAQLPWGTLSGHLVQRFTNDGYPILVELYYSYPRIDGEKFYWQLKITILNK